MKKWPFSILNYGYKWFDEFLVFRRNNNIENKRFTGTGNHHVGEYLDDRKHGPGKYNFIQTGKRLDGTWSNDIPVLGEISQLCRHKPSFPHQYPLPPQGLRDPRAVLADGLLDAYCAVPPEPLRPLACPADPEPRAMPQPPLSLAHSRLLGSSGAGADNGEMDMRQLLVELEPEVAAITDSHVAAKTGNYLLAMEYWWRCTADRAGPRPLRMQRLMAKDSQELLSLADDWARSQPQKLTLNKKTIGKLCSYLAIQTWKKNRINAIVMRYVQYSTVQYST